MLLKLRMTDARHDGIAARPVQDEVILADALDRPWDAFYERISNEMAKTYELNDAVLDFLDQRLQQLKESEERLQRVLQGTNDGWWDWDLRTGKCIVSARWLEMLDYEPASIVRDDFWHEDIHDDDRLAFGWSLERALTGAANTSTPTSTQGRVQVQLVHLDDLFVIRCNRRNVLVEVILCQAVRVVLALSNQVNSAKVHQKLICVCFIKAVTNFEVLFVVKLPHAG